MSTLGFFEKINNLGYSIINTLGDFFNWATTNNLDEIIDNAFNDINHDTLFSYIGELALNIVNFFVDTLGLGNFTLLELVLGSGIIFVVVWQLISWVIDLLP